MLMKKPIIFKVILAYSVIFSEKSMAENQLPDMTPELNQKTTNNSSSPQGMSAEEYKARFSHPSYEYADSHPNAKGYSPPYAAGGYLMDREGGNHGSNSPFIYGQPNSSVGNPYFAPSVYPQALPQQGISSPQQMVPSQGVSPQMISPTAMPPVVYYMPSPEPLGKSKISTWMVSGLMILTPIVGAAIAWWRGEFDGTAENGPVGLAGGLVVAGILGLVQTGINIAQRVEGR
jgi:hypothetical protein